MKSMEEKNDHAKDDEEETKTNAFKTETNTHANSINCRNKSKTNNNQLCYGCGKPGHF